MESATPTKSREVFISYSSRNRERVLEIAGRLESAGMTIWRDQNEILGGENYGPEIVRGIRDCKVVLLLCSEASMRSKNVKQEIQLAWHYERPYLPVLLEPLDGYPEQIQYWMEGCQWIEVLDRPAEQWLPRVLQALAVAGAHSDGAAPSPGVRPTPATPGLAGLRALARFTDQIWPVAAGSVHRGATRSGFRDLGAPQDDVQHGHHLGSRVCIVLETERPGHLLLLDEGPSGKIYCLCPSAFAPDTRLKPGRTYLPQAASRYPSFAVLGKPGREHLLAILTDDPLDLDWMPAEPKVPARVLSPADVEQLLTRLRALPGDKWTALATYFEVLA